MDRDDQDLKDFIGSEGEVVIPHAILDTNVMLTTYSWHNLVRAMDRANTKDPNTSLHDADIQFRAQQLRWGFLLSIFFDEKGWTTICPVAEFKRKLADQVDPNNPDHEPRVGYTTIYTQFVRDLILPRWSVGGYEVDDQSLKGNEVDAFCARRAAKHGAHLISWEGVSHTGDIDNEKAIRKEAAARGVRVLTPRELLERERFDTRPGKERFFRIWDTEAPGFIERLGGHTRANLAFARQIFARLARNDWDP